MTFCFLGGSVPLPWWLALVGFNIWYKDFHTLTQFHVSIYRSLPQTSLTLFLIYFSLQAHEQPARPFITAHVSIYIKIRQLLLLYKCITRSLTQIFAHWQVFSFSFFQEHSWERLPCSCCSFSACIHIPMKYLKNSWTNIRVFLSSTSYHKKFLILL